MHCPTVLLRQHFLNLISYSVFTTRLFTVNAEETDSNRPNLRTSQRDSHISLSPSQFLKSFTSKMPIVPLDSMSDALMHSDPSLSSGKSSGKTIPNCQRCSLLSALITFVFGGFPLGKSVPMTSSLRRMIFKNLSSDSESGRDGSIPGSLKDDKSVIPLVDKQGNEVELGEVSIKNLYLKFEVEDNGIGESPL